MQEAMGKWQNQKKRISPITILFMLAALILVVGGMVNQFSGRGVSTASKNASTGETSLSAPRMPSGAPVSLNMGMPGATTPVTSLQAPLTAAHEKHFTLTAQPAQLSLPGVSGKIPAWTFNGSAPGPTLRVQQGDLVIVTVVNHLSFGVTIHWHGIDVPNAADGVAGVTQDAIKPGQSYTYRFFANDPGTYWYHSHQFSYDETTGGLYGTLIVDPARPMLHDDVDVSVSLHDWEQNDGEIFAIDNTTGIRNIAARPGQWVRLRVVNTSSDQHLVTLLGAPFQVVALDGHDLNGPQMLMQTPLPIGAAQRYDLRFQMPAHGTVTLVSSADNRHYQANPAVIIGQGRVPTTLPPVQSKWFDITSYGVPKSDSITLHSHFDATYSIILGNHEGKSLGRMGMTYTMNGKAFPDTGMIMLQEGQLVRMHLDNQSDLIHPIHLHGHVFTVLEHNGKPLTGSPIHLDTINIQPHDSYDIAFLANNPGIWMLHCHNLLHADWGMDMMVMYNNISTPYTVGTASGNFPD